MIEAQNPTQGLIAKLERRDVICPAERRALETALGSPVLHTAGSMIIEAGAWPRECRLLVSGLAARIDGLEAGERSVTQLSVAGDFLDIHSLVMKQVDHGVLAISDCITAGVSHERLKTIIARHPHLGRLLWLEMAVDGAIQREWFHRLGRQDSLRRMAHLLCELDARLEVVGLGDAGGFSFTLTQQDFSDCLGMSVVHVNRTLAELRRRDLLAWHGGRVEMVDRAGLRRLAEFDPTYLRLHAAPI